MTKKWEKQEKKEKTPHGKVPKPSKTCTACSKELHLDPTQRIYIHPLLRVLVCDTCFDNYGDGDFSKYPDGIDEEGDDNYCRWCADGGDLLVCCKEECHYAYCRKCIKRNLGSQKYKDISSSEDWFCFACDKSQISEFIEFATEMEAKLKMVNGSSKKRSSIQISPSTSMDDIPFKRTKPETNRAKKSTGKIPAVMREKSESPKNVSDDHVKNNSKSLTDGLMFNDEDDSCECDSKVKGKEDLNEKVEDATKVVDSAEDSDKITKDAQEEVEEKSEKDADITKKINDDENITAESEEEKENEEEKEDEDKEETNKPVKDEDKTECDEENDEIPETPESILDQKFNEKKEGEKSNESLLETKIEIASDASTEGEFEDDDNQPEKTLDILDAKAETSKEQFHLQFDVFEERKSDPKISEGVKELDQLLDDTNVEEKADYLNELRKAISEFKNISLQHEMIALKFLEDLNEENLSSQLSLLEEQIIKYHNISLVLHRLAVTKKPSNDN